jgi:hypothetical protein
MLTLAFNIQPAKAKLPLLTVPEESATMQGTINLASQEPPPTEWNKTYGGTKDDIAYAMVKTADGGYLLAGGYLSSRRAFWLVKVDANGNAQWNKTYDGPDNDEVATSVQQTTDGGYIVAGNQGDSYHTDIWLVKTDSAGNMQWNQTYGRAEAEFEYAHSVQQTSDGGYIISGETGNRGQPWSWDYWLVKTNANGNVEWSKTYGGAASDWGHQAQQTADGGYIIVGGTTSFGAGGQNGWLVKTDASGTLLWSKTYGRSGDDYLQLVQKTSDGGYALAGITDSFGAGSDDFWLVKTDANGNIQWERTYGGAGYEFASSFQQTSDGGYALAGFTDSFGAGGDDFWLVKTDSAGIMQWNQTYGGTRDDYAYSVVQANDGGYAIAGCTYSFGAGGSDMWLVKTGWTDFDVRIVGYTISLDPDYTVNAVLNVTMLSPHAGSKEVTCCLVLIDTAGNEVYDNFVGIGGPQDDKNTLVENNTITSVEFTFQLQEPHPGEYAYTISIWSSDKGEMYDSTDWVPAFNIRSWPVYWSHLGTLHANSYLQDNPLFLCLKRYDSINYTFTLAENVTDLSVKVFTLPDSEFICTLNAKNAQMDFHGELLPYYNVWHNVPANTYDMNLEIESSIANVIRVMIQAGQSIETPTVQIISAEGASDFAAPNGIMNYKIDVRFSVATEDTLTLTSTFGGQTHDTQTFTVEPFKSNEINAYLQVNAPPETGQYTVSLNALLVNSGALDSTSSGLTVAYSTYNITVSPTVQYYQDRLRLKFWEKGHTYVDDSTKLAALDVTDIKISGIDRLDPQTQKPTTVSISFMAANKEKGIHHVVYVEVGSFSYQLGAVISGDDPSRMEAHNIPVIDDKISFTLAYRKWFFGNWGAEFGSQAVKTILTLVLPCVAPQWSPAWFATGDVIKNLATYSMLYLMQFWMEREHGYMTMDEATRIMENAGIQRNVFESFLETAVGITRNPCHSLLATLEYLHDNGRISTWSFIRAVFAALAHIFGRAETRVLDGMTEALVKAAAKLGITLIAVDLVKQKLGEVLNPKCFLQTLGKLMDITKSLSIATKILLSPSEEGKEVSQAELGQDHAVRVDPVISISFKGQMDFTNETCLGDMLSMNVSLNQTEAMMILEVDRNLTAVHLPILSDSVCRSEILSSFGFNATKTSLDWMSENATFVLQATGSSYSGVIGLQFYMNSTYVEGIQEMSADALGTGNIAWLNGTLSYPFGKSLDYEINVTLPRGSEITQILSDGNFTVEDSTVAWNAPIDGLAIEFVPPNVAITEVVSAKTVIGQDCCTRVNVTATDYSTSTQTVNITVYANETIIGTQTAFLESKMSMIIILDWSTAGLARGNYTISAHASQVQGEANLADNNLTGGWVVVAGIGDLTGGTPNPWDFVPDGKVLIEDVSVVAKCFGQHVPPAPANCDVSGPTIGVPDGKILIDDVALVSKHFGEHYP